jgi:hypothetical protein
VGQQGKHGQQQQDEYQDEGERQDEGVQVWRQGGGQSGGFARVFRPNSSYTSTWGLTASRQQRRRLRPGAPEATETRLGHTRANREGITSRTAQVAQYALCAAFQDLHLGAGPGQGAGRAVTKGCSQSGRGSASPKHCSGPMREGGTAYLGPRLIRARVPDQTAGET